ncbi:MAG TPA: phosphodiester glycosidase family protein [Flexilinea sp.]|nr:phosphodiester glycosidase family protein [Flexilinea sp.]HOR55709.1 phosphodiester glycosidase family protein [Flexilinea sp.]
MGIFGKKYKWGVIYTILLIAFTAYVVLDTFVIARVYAKVSSEENTGIQNVSESTLLANPVMGSTPQATPEETAEQNNTIPFTGSAVITDNSYSDRNIRITITKYREYDTTIYVADVRVSSAEYLQTAFARGAFGRNITENTSTIAEANNAILAINGDYYGAQTKGYVLKNGVLYRESASGNKEDLVIWVDGSFEIITEGEVTAQTLAEDGALQVLSFGPALIMDGAIVVSENEEVGKAKASNPRTAIGIIDELHYLFVVSDGRTSTSEGLSLYQLAEFMQGLGADVAYNLDGGGSSTMVFNGEVINNPTTNGNNIKERSVSDIVYIGY